MLNSGTDYSHRKLKKLIGAQHTHQIPTPCPHMSDALSNLMEVINYTTLWSFLSSDLWSRIETDDIDSYSFFFLIEEKV